MFRTLFLIGALAFPGLSHAAVVTVEEASTRAGDVNGIVGVDGASTEVSNPAYSTEVTDPASDWVWILPTEEFATRSWTWAFDLTGYNLSTAAISGRWGTDNSGRAVLNGTEIATVGDFQSLSDFDYAGSAFVAGSNTLTFIASNVTGPAAFRAALEVEAAPVPLPAGLPLVLAGLAALGIAGRKRAA